MGGEEGSIILTPPSFPAIHFYSDSNSIFPYSNSGASYTQVEDSCLRQKFIEEIQILVQASLRAVSCPSKEVK